MSTQIDRPAPPPKDHTPLVEPRADLDSGKFLQRTVRCEPDLSAERCSCQLRPNGRKSQPRGVSVATAAPLERRGADRSQCPVTVGLPA